MSLTVALLEILRCPSCKGPLVAGAAILSCAACRANYRWDTTLACWDLRPLEAVRPIEVPPRPGGVDVSTDPSLRRTRLWHALRAAHPELPRQGVALSIDVPSSAHLGAPPDSFRHEVQFVSAPSRVYRMRAEGRHPPAALVDPSKLPIASQSIDLVDAELLDSPAGPLERRLAEVHRVLAPSGHGYVTGRAPSSSVEDADVAARSSLGDGYAWVPASIGMLTGTATAATVHRHLQSWVGFEYTLGHGARARQGTRSRGWLVRLRSDRELVCWRTRPATTDWKSTSSDEPMIFGRFHFPAPAPPA